jgi:CheY-like chemotaxis protein
MLPHKILIVDDERVIRFTTGVLLKKHSVELLAAESGEDGIALARAEKPELILLDIMMPGLDGWAVLDMLRESPETRGIKVVLFSAGDYAETERRANERGGVHAILRKPFQMEELLAVCDIPGEST